MKARILFLFIVPLFLYVILLPAMPLMEPDEARYSDIPSLMNSTGDYITPHLHHVIYLEKPPLSYWATALSFKIFGENDFSSRLFVGLCAWGCIILVYFMGIFFAGEKTGLYSAGVLSTFLYHAAIGRINILDIPLAFFVCLATWAGYRYIKGNHQKKIWVYLLYIASALAFLTKGLIGIVFPFAILVLWLIICKKWRDILRLFSPGGILIFLAISCPWIILVQKANKDFLWFFFIHEQFLRYATDISRKSGPFYYYIPIIILGTLPWCAFLFQAIRGVSGKTTRLWQQIDIRFLLTWAIFIFLFFSVSSSKLIPYITPAFLPIAVIFGHFFQLYESREIVQEETMGKRVLLHSPVILTSCLFIIALCIPPFLKKHAVAGSEWIPLVMLPILLQVLIIFLPDIIKRKWNKGWFLTVYLLAALFLGSLVFPASHFLTPYKSAYPVSQAIKTSIPAGQELYQYGINLYGIDFYNKIRTPVVDDFGELNYGIRRLPPDERSRYFLSSEKFFELCKEKGDIYCVTKYSRRVEELQKVIPKLEIIWDNGAYFILRLHC
ncbi:MAG: glycosyltransferase family 39 protein [Deltaproteobacteria bacterium]|nr:glycosyltransferase family 39 protein [Deltaproteobacteria bacterium]